MLERFFDDIVTDLNDQDIELNIVAKKGSQIRTGFLRREKSLRNIEALWTCHYGSHAESTVLAPKLSRSED